MTPLEVVSQLLNVPEDCVPESGLALIVYMDTRGKQQVHYGFLGDDASLFQMIGSLETVKTFLANAALVPGE